MRFFYPCFCMLLLSLNDYTRLWDKIQPSPAYIYMPDGHV